tara:strand:+ start:109 stop:315 length:207 start_codon:yes stop_codon:yes gene_type:complete
MAQQRIWFAEDIAFGMERLAQVREEFAGERVNATKIVADEFGMEPASFKALIHKAAHSGFDKFPMRGE